MTARPWHRWQLFAVDRRFEDGGWPGMAEDFNMEPQRFLFRRSAKRTARFYERELGLPVRFYVLPVEKTSQPLED